MKQLKFYRTAAGLTTADVAYQLRHRYNIRVSLPTLHRWERGISGPKPEILRALAGILGKRVEDLI